MSRLTVDRIAPDQMDLWVRMREAGLGLVYLTAMLALQSSFPHSHVLIAAPR